MGSADRTLVLIQQQGVEESALVVDENFIAAFQAAKRPAFSAGSPA
jgi:hypothetical protein